MTGKPLILALDQGTTSSRAAVFDGRGQIVASAQSEFPQHFPQPGWVEHDPEDIWNTTVTTARRAIAEAERGGDGEVACIGLTNQRETVIVWNRETGAPLGRAIVWQDRRTAGICDTLRKAGHENFINTRTGLTIDPYFSGTKLNWILKNSEEAKALADRGKLAFGTVDSYLVWRLTGGKKHVTDETNASRTLLYNIVDGRWDDDLLALNGVPASVLPDVLPSAARFGETEAGLFGRSLPICGVAGDQQAAAFGQACWHQGMIKSTYGTGCFLLAHTGTNLLLSSNRLLSTLACRTGSAPEYAMEGSIFIAGAISQWLRDELQIVESAAETETLARATRSNDGVYIVPAFTGLGAPHWDSEARGTIFGLTRSTGRPEIARAALESVAYQTLDLIDALVADGFEPGRIRVDGGMVANNWFLQFLSDVTGVSIDRPTIIESTARGAAFLAGLHSGIFADTEALETLWSAEHQFEPQMTGESRKALVSGWDKAVKATLYRAALDRE